MADKLIIPHDIEDVLQNDLGALCNRYYPTYSVSATPIPGDLGRRIPWAVVYDVGGFRTSRVVDTHAVSVDVYAATWAQATEAANNIAGLVDSLMDRDDVSVDYHRASITSLPYSNPDPDHADIPRVTFNADVILSAKF